MKNPAWARDELVLALDLYFSLRPGEIHARNPKIIELSDLLNGLPIHDVRPDEAKFRNPNGVGLKLSNFKAIDPNYSGKGLTRTSKLDRVIFQEFTGDRERLSLQAQRIREVVQDETIRTALEKVDNSGGDDFEVKEGKVIFKLHKIRERNRTLVEKKKRQIFNQLGSLSCEVCEFNFESVYGEIGKGFIECHHRVPLADLTSETLTTLDDLAVVCANCHRMLHYSGDLSIESLRSALDT